jgi:predicted HTH transcriptional regulator
MQKKRVFISSVQSEFADERQMLFDYLTTDSLLCKFFEPFIFEKIPALAVAPNTVFLQEVENCDIYLGLFGLQYGYEDSEGVSPTEREFDCAAKLHKTKFVYISNHADNQRDAKEIALIRKAEKSVVRRKFSNELDLRVSVYNSLIRYLEEKEFIRTLPFDADFHNNATLNDLNEEKIRNFIYVAHRKRAFPFESDGNIKTVLTHLNLVESKRITNAALLLFGKNPQKFFITSEIRCGLFPTSEVTKPILSYQVYKGDVFQLVTQATQFVLSNIRSMTGIRNRGVQVEVEYELPIAAVTEAIVNAVCHRDYTSNASIQVMLFPDRLEVWNPGHLPFGMTVEKLKKVHTSIPVNPLIAEPMYLNGTIERMGTGTRDIVRLCRQAGLKEPVFQQEEFFTTVLWRKKIKREKIENPENIQVSTQVSTQVERLLYKFDNDIMSVEELQKAFNFKERRTFARNYIQPALKLGLIEMTIPDKPNSRLQKYRLTDKGIQIKASIGK